MASTFDSMIDMLAEGIDKKDRAPTSPAKSRRPLKMPKAYDFSVRNVDWGEYKEDYLLRTDAVWERTKLLDIFYVHYKSKFLYDTVNNKYMIANIR